MLIRQNKEDCIHKHLVPEAEYYEKLSLHIAVPTRIPRTPHQMLTRQHHLVCNRIRNRQQQQKTCFNFMNSNPNYRLPKGYSSTNPDGDKRTRNLDQKIKMELG